MKKMIKFAMQNISIDQFAILCDSMPEDCKYQTDVQIGVDKENMGVAVRMRVTYLNSEESAILIIQTTCIFSINQKDWSELTIKDDKILLPHGFVAHLAMHVLGTMRGILYCKTTDTSIGTIILPPTNVDKLFREDVEIG